MRRAAMSGSATARRVDGALHHNTAYDFNDEAIASGVTFWTTLVEQELKPEA
jgi:metal-dependent amidase/aminoacylase/carboxypeptidase family protein